MVILIQADTYHKAKACAEMYDLQPMEWVFLDSVEKIMGRSGDSCIIWRYNGWVHHKDAEALYEEAIVRNIKIFDKEEKFTGDYNKHAYAHAKRIMPERK